MTNAELEKKANEVRQSIVTALHSAKSGHPGGSLSAADIMTYLYFEEMNVDPKNPKMADRDRFVLSKGHVAPALYSVLAHKGYFPVEDLVTLRHTGSYLQGHPDMKHIPGVDMSAGSLGQGLSCAVGMAQAGKMDDKDYQVYAMCGDGEIQEGQIWEAAMWAGAHHLDNLTVIVDNNNLQIDGTVEEVCSPYPIDKKFEAFNFHVININGNDMEEIRNAFAEAKKVKGMPVAIIAKTTKGKGVSFMENQVGWHGKAPNDEQYEQAMEDFEGCMPLCDDEMGIAVLYWHTLSAARTEKAPTLLKYDRPDMAVGHHTAYEKAMQVWSGTTPLAAALEMLESEEDDLEYGTTLYGLLWHPDCTEKARLFKVLLRRDGFWPSFAYIAAWKDWDGLRK